ncbi:SGNH/GDSL hydrolase family protein [Oricola thermophila]|uniref:SGNH/GDSL hydrolase family protein n=1 Tax=Oricola thermophila TaxID=2742145 RepID=A0A6N1VB91_9HYPH|nr:SGNH/GDSL hydrolase family protein [Oricola thermophila]QKV18184.1 SGNH/GDSL hydrolase family protein [Oricola thermophila]
MKTVLAFGDSLTWGYDPAGPGRHAREDRWPVALADALGGRVEVVSEGLNGRTTAFDDHLGEADRNGARLLPTLLATHKPLDLVIIMLGTNDLKPSVHGQAIAAKQGIARLVSIIRHHDWSLDAGVPEVLIVAPPPLCETNNPDFAAMFAGKIEESHMLGSMYADLADDLECGFYDAASVAKTSPLDGIHLDAANSKAIGKALAPVVSLMLGL